MLSSILVYLLVAASYLQARIDHGGNQRLMRRLVGEDVDAYADQFGVVFWNLPFYVLSRILQIAHGGDWIDHVLIGALAVAVASTAAVVALFYVSWRLIRDIGLRGGPGAILLTVFGSPLFYYSIFQTSLKHAFDALLVTLMALLLLHASVRTASRRLVLAIGLVAAVLISVRYANIVLLTGIAYVFLRRREFLQAYVASATAIVGATAILAFPLVLGIPYGLPPPTGSADGPSSRIVARLRSARTERNPGPDGWSCWLPSGNRRLRTAAVVWMTSVRSNSTFSRRSRCSLR